MAVAFVKKNSGQSGSSSTGLTATLASAPAQGNLLVFAMAGDKNTGTLTLAGFTQAVALTSTSVSLYVAWAVSDGTETAISPTWANSSQFGNTYHYGEYADAAISGSTWQVSAQATNITAEVNVTSWSTGTTGAATDDGLGMAFIAMDSADSVVDGTTAWTNSYTARHTTLNSAGARGGLHIAEKQIAAAATTETTFSFTASTTNRDQLTGAVLVFTKVSEDYELVCHAHAAGRTDTPAVYAVTPALYAAAAGNATVAYGQDVLAGTIAVAAAAAAAEAAPNLQTASRADTAGHAAATLAAGPNDVAAEVHATAAGSAHVPIIQTFPPPTPAERLHTVPAETRVHVVPKEAAEMPRTWLKDPSDHLDYGWDWQAWLDDGETIDTSEVDIPSGITMTQHLHSGTTVSIWLSGGTVDETYTIPGKITTSVGRTVERSIAIRVEQL